VIEETKLSEDLHIDFPFAPKGYEVYWSTPNFGKAIRAPRSSARSNRLSVTLWPLAKINTTMRAASSPRSLYPTKVQYSWWSYRFNARASNAGWRIDYFVVSSRLMKQVEDSSIHNEIFGSDHCPIELDLHD
jgi:exodeoxyribonuclease-3